MGCGTSSRRKFIMNPSLEGQDEAAVETFRQLGLSENDVDLLFTAFSLIDEDDSNAIQPAEFFKYFEIEGTKFEYMIFEIFDEDKSGFINFMEFVCAVWNLLTLPEKDFGSLAYMLKDPSCELSIKFKDVRDILELMHKKKVEKNPALYQLFEELKANYSGVINIDQFCHWTTSNRFVTSPILMLQLHLRTKIIDETFWLRLAEQRIDYPEEGKLDYVKKLQAMVTEKNKQFKLNQMAKKIQDKKLERVNMGRDGINKSRQERNESLLLKHFNLKQISFQLPNRKGKYKIAIDDKIVDPADDKIYHTETAMDSKKQEMDEMDLSNHEWIQDNNNKSLSSHRQKEIEKVNPKSAARVKSVALSNKKNEIKAPKDFDPIMSKKKKKLKPILKVNTNDDTNDEERLDELMKLNENENVDRPVSSKNGPSPSSSRKRHGSFNLSQSPTDHTPSTTTTTSTVDNSSSSNNSSMKPSISPSNQNRNKNKSFFHQTKTLLVRKPKLIR